LYAIHAAIKDFLTEGLQVGVFLPSDILWARTVIPAVNTDPPGDVIAGVTQNIYDSQTGRKMLLPQGPLLYAKYNSSVSYAQRRVQIVWNLLIRPDGYQLEL
jgi:type IV secretion system protein VirB10